MRSRVNQFAREQESHRAPECADTHYCTRWDEFAAALGSGLLALRRLLDRRICQRLQLDNGRSPVDTPEIHDFPATGNPSWQGQNLGLGGRLVFGELHLKRNLVATELGCFLVQLGGFGARCIQLAAQFAIASLQHLKETNVLKTFDMEFFPGQPGIG